MVRAEARNQDRNDPMSTATNDARQWLQPGRGLSAALDYAGASHRRACGLLIVFSLNYLQPVHRVVSLVDSLLGVERKAEAA